MATNPPTIRVYLVSDSSHRFRLKAVITSDGRPVERWQRLRGPDAVTAESREAARAAFGSLLAQQFGLQRPKSFAELVESFYGSAQFAALRPSSQATLRWHVTRDCLPTLAGVALAAVNGADCARCIEQKAAPNSRRRIRAVLSKIFGWAMTQDLMDRNPVRDVPPAPKTRGMTPRSLTDEQYAALAEAADGSPWGVVIELLAASWLRRGELCGLQWHDVDWHQRTLTVRRAVWQAGGNAGLAPPKTQSGHRAIVLGQSIMTLLGEQRERRTAQVAADGARALRGDDFIFTNPDNTHLMPSHVSHAIRKLMNRAGIPAGLGPHALRHTGATAAMAVNSDPRAVADRLGHASVTTTLDLYVHPSRAQQEGLAALMERRRIRANN